MKQIWATVSERGQVTIPAEVRRLLGLRKRDRVTFIIEDGCVRIERPKYATVADVVGSLPPLGMDIDEAIRIAKEEHRDERLKRKLADG
jgi:AbrB family looped-hinge helix DNA binding protein